MNDNISTSAFSIPSFWLLHTLITGYLMSVFRSTWSDCPDDVHGMALIALMQYSPVGLELA